MNRMQRNSQMGGSSCKERMDLLRTVDFAIQETVLYLDAYPNCSEALDYYHKLIAQRREILEHYEKNCGPITMYGNESKSSWDWIASPWPWEADAN
jgi:hypothetical protein